MSMNIECDGCGMRLGEVHDGVRENRVVGELTKVDSHVLFGAGMEHSVPDLQHLCQRCMVAVREFIANRRFVQQYGDALADPPGGADRAATVTPHG